MSITYEVVLRPGCHTQPYPPILSQHRSLRRAVAAARKSDRWMVTLDGVCIWKPPSRSGSRENRQLGAGLWGAGPQPGETLAEAVREAESAAREVLARRGRV